MIFRSLRSNRLIKTLAGTATALALLATAACGAASTPGQSASSSASGSDASFPLTLQHAMGSTTIPEKPLRIVALDPSYVDATLLLGGKLVGYAQYRQDPKSPFARYLGDVSEQTKDAVNVGTMAEPNLEKILDLKPDLIISAKVRQEALYPQLAKIAPTVFSQSTGPTWKQNIVLLGTAMGEKAKAESLVASYVADAKKLGAEILAKDPAATYSLVRFVGESTARLYSSKSFIGEIMNDMGIPRPQGAPDSTDQIFVTLSTEEILKADAKTILVATWKTTGSEGEKAVAQSQEFESNPLWSRLTGKKVEVDDATFVASVSIQGARAVMAELAKSYGVTQ
ncbi:ABC transporter substrate-binding protein [Renibacterium salmoninarum]|uniref:ABC transporter substrate-binding protein n=1 Tax=Renibacterium salmoninarum TaxID=1646 RepID=UPI00030B8858|nr:iron-siderophore ABC transporter substrate-binding protein [Renibacterium salmoninarum]